MILVVQHHHHYRPVVFACHDCYDSILLLGVAVAAAVAVHSGVGPA